MLPGFSLGSNDQPTDPARVICSQPTNSQFFFGGTKGNQPATYFEKEWQTAGIYKVTFEVDGLKLAENPTVVVIMQSAEPCALIITQEKSAQWLATGDGKPQPKLGLPCNNANIPDLCFHLEDKCVIRLMHLPRFSSFFAMHWH